MPALTMFDELPPREVARKIADDAAWQLLDVREAWERELASVPDSLHIPMQEIQARVDELDRRRPVAVLCHSGVRSARVAAFLTAAGFEQVANVTGGIDAWSEDVDGSIPRY